MGFYRCAIVAALLGAGSPVFGAYTVTNLTPMDASSAQGFAIGGGMQGGGATFGGNTLAYLWNGAAPGTNLDALASNNANGSFVLSVTSTQAAGYVADATFAPHAALWTPANTTPFQLLPEANADTTFSDTTAASLGGEGGGAGGVIAGFGTIATGSHALVWTSPTAAPQDLHPKTATYLDTGIGYVSSQARSTDGTMVVGNAALNSTGNFPHAALWNLATGGSFTDLHPSGYVSSNAVAVAGTHIVGFGLSGADDATTHALLWTLPGPGDSGIKFTDINPAGFDTSLALGTNGTQDVGYATDSLDDDHAIVWNSPTAFEDLSTELPAGEYVSSQAVGIDAEGDIIGTATDVGGKTYAILWTPKPAEVPEPASGILLAIPALLLLRRRGGRKPVVGSR